MRVWGGRTLPVAVLVPMLFAYACRKSTDASNDGGTGGTGGSVGGSSMGGAGGSGIGGSAGDTGGGGTDGGSANGGSGGATTSDTGSTGGSGGPGPAGAGGEAGAPESSSTGGTAGAAAVTCVPTLPPDTSCEYPESLGGGGDSEACGVTPGAWFGIGDELTEWPELATVPPSPDGSFREKVGEHQLAFDAASRPVLAWEELDPTGESVLRIIRWDGSEWIEVENRPLQGVTKWEILVDSRGRPLLLFRSSNSSVVELFRLNDAGWTTLGTWPEASQASVVLDANDRPTVLMYSHVKVGDFLGQFVVQRRIGSTWEDLGAPQPGQYIDEPVLALRANGDPVVAFYSDSDVMLRQWNGSSWGELANSASGSGIGMAPDHSDRYRPEDRQIALGVDASDHVIVAWGGTYRLWNGSAWSAVAPAGGSRPRLARNADGALYLLTESGVTGSESLQERLLFHWTNDAFEPLPPAVAEYTEAVDLAVAPDGTVGTAFGYQQVLYRSYAEGEWTSLDTPAGTDIGVDLAPYGDVPEVPPVYYYCSLSQWNGTTWEVLPPPTDAHSCAFQRNADGDAYLAFWVMKDQDYFSHLLVVRQTDNGWELVGDAVTAQSYVETPETQIAIDSQGRPVVAWLNSEEGYTQAYVKFWNGSSWTGWGDSTSVPVPYFGVDEQQLILTEDDRPVLASVEYIPEMLQVREWTGEGWRHSAIMSPDGDGFGGWLDYALTLDATGAIVVTRVTSSTLDVFRWSGSEWERLAPTDDVLADLPLSVRAKTANEGGDVLFSYFEDCAWRGLSASDRGGGVSNSTAPSGSRGVVATEDVVCVAWAEGEGENMLMRCHERPF